MKRVLVCVILLLSLPLSTGPRAQQAPNRPGADPAIRLVLLVVVDQFRHDYLTRFGTEYSGAFSSLLSRGATFTNANLEHYPTVTAVGHATMLTGATPSVHGIVGNDWYDRGTNGSVTSVSDPTTKVVGAQVEGAGSSPRRLLVGTVGDELKMASLAAPGSDRAPRVVSLSLKDRSAVLMGGHMADLALWFDQGAGAFVTSTYYRAEFPAWASEFNAKKLPDSFAGKPWTFLTPSPGPTRVMPAEPGAKLYQAIAATPFGNDLLVDLAEAALTAEKLGQRGVTDLFAVSFSANDGVGHAYGPDSPEVRDISIKTDKQIERLLARVDALVGAGRTLVIFTSDHGVAPLPELQASRRMPGGRVKAADLFTPIQTALEQRFGAGKWILATAGSSPYLNHALIAEKKLDGEEVREVARQAAAGLANVARVHTREQLLRGQVPDDMIGRRIVRSHHPQRSGDLEIILTAYWMRSSAGTTHGTPYWYDAHIPLIFAGPGIRQGRYDQPVALNDLAPTLATLLGLQTPAGAEGRVIAEILDELPPAGARRPTP